MAGWLLLTIQSSSLIVVLKFLIDPSESRTFLADDYLTDGSWKLKCTR